jgi:hypothetical protein
LELFAYRDQCIVVSFSRGLTIDYKHDVDRLACEMSGIERSGYNFAGPRSSLSIESFLSGFGSSSFEHHDRMTFSFGFSEKKLDLATKL